MLLFPAMRTIFGIKGIYIQHRPSLSLAQSQHQDSVAVIHTYPGPDVAQCI